MCPLGGTACVGGPGPEAAGGANRDTLSPGAADAAVDHPGRRELAAGGLADHRIVPDRVVEVGGGPGDQPVVHRLVGLVNRFAGGVYPGTSSITDGVENGIGVSAVHGLVP